MATCQMGTAFELIPLDDDKLAPLRVPVTLTYDPAEPFVVGMRFLTGPEWLIDRELLAAGLIAKTGVGDITVAPMPNRADHMRLTLSSPSGMATLAVHTGTIGDFLRRTYDLVRLGTELERLDLDAWITAALDAGDSLGGAAA